MNLRKISAILWVGALFLVVGCGSPAPIEVHLTVQGDASSTVTVTWVTTSDSDTATHTVQMGPSSGNYTQSFSGSSHGRPNVSGYVHDVEATGLTPDTTYYYICGDESGGWSEEHSFTTAPVSAQDFSFAAVGDMGVTPAAAANLDQILARDNSFVLHAGDLSYANGVTAYWDLWFDQIEPVAASMLYMPAIGNHEDESAYGLSSYLGRFALPNNEHWYSFDWGNVHVVALDTEADYTAGSDQLVWLDADLALASADPDIDWIVAFFHKPPYSASTAHGSDLAVRANISPVLEGYGVDVVFAGHDHCYERTYPIFNEAVVDTDPSEYTNPAGTIYIVTGGAGAGLYGVGTDYWTAYSESIHEFVQADVLASGTLRLQAISKAGVLLDECLIHK